MASTAFDTLSALHALEKVGVDEKHARVLVEQLSKAAIHEHDELITNTRLAAQLSVLESRLLRFGWTMGISIIGIMLALMAAQTAFLALI